MKLEKGITQHDIRIERLVQRDIEGLRQRAESYKNEVRRADMVVVTLTCSDSRVVVPDQSVQIQMESGKNASVLFVEVPTIGSGAPSRSRIRGVFSELIRWGVAEEKLRVLVTQHGDTKEVMETKRGEIPDSPQHVSCGLRKFFSQKHQSLQQIRSLLVPWSDELKRKTGDIKRAPDRLPMEQLEKECPDIIDLARTLSKETGPEGYRIPTRLILRAAYRDVSAHIHGNGEAVRERIAGYLRLPEHVSLFQSCTVALAQYDHQEKQLHFVHPYATLGFADTTVSLPMPKRTVFHQDPQSVVLSFGQESIALHKGIVFPHIAGKEHIAPSDNTFRACASIPSGSALLCAFAEASYAVVHHLHPHEGDRNFVSLEGIVGICDTMQYATALQDAVKTTEFRQEYDYMFREFTGGTIPIVVLHTDNPKKPAEYMVVSF